MRETGKNIDFIHKLRRDLENKMIGPHMVIITKEPEKIKKDLLSIGCYTEYDPVHEGILGLDLENPKRAEDYIPKIIGYKFRIISE
jgi:hypothetical protein